MLRDLPDGQKKALRTIWPATVSPSLVELIETQEITMREVRSLRPAVTPRRVFQMEQAIEWPDLAGPMVAPIVRLKCLWEVNGGVWERRLERRGWDRDWFARTWQGGVIQIAAELNRQAVPVD